MRGRSERHGRIVGVIHCKDANTFMKWLVERPVPAGTAKQLAFPITPVNIRKERLLK